MAIKLNFQSDSNVALAWHLNKLWMVYVNCQRRLVVASSSDGQDWTEGIDICGLDIREPVLGSGPALCVHHSSLFVAWSGAKHGTSAHPIHLISSKDGIHWGNSITLPERSLHGPSIISKGSKLYIAWTGTDRHLNVAVSTTNGSSWGNKWTLPETSIDGPSLALHNKKLHIAWAGTDSGRKTHSINVMSLKGKEWASKVTLDETSDHTPALASTGEKLYLSWTGRDCEQRLNISSSSDGFVWEQDDRRTLRHSCYAVPALVTFKSGMLVAWVTSCSTIAVLSYGEGRVIANPTNDLNGLESLSDDIPSAVPSLPGWETRKGTLSKADALNLLANSYLYVIGAHGYAPHVKSVDGSALLEHDSRLYVAWPQENEELKVMRSLDGWSWENERVFHDPKTSLTPALCLHNGRAVLAWTDRNGQLNITNSPDGESWTATTTIPGASSDHGPALASLNGRLYLAWVNQGRGHYVRIKSGTDWNSFDREISLNSRGANSPSMTICRGQLYLAWTGDDDGGTPHVMRSPDGMTWSDESVFSGYCSPRGPSVSILGNKVVLHWISRDADGRLLLHRRSSDDGLRWEESDSILWGDWIDYVSGPNAVSFRGLEYFSWTHNGIIHLSCETQSGRQTRDLTLGDARITATDGTIYPADVRAIGAGPSELFWHVGCLTGSVDTLAQAFFDTGTKHYIGFGTVVRDDSGTTNFVKESLSRWEKSRANILEILDQVDDMYPRPWVLHTNPNVL